MAGKPVDKTKKALEPNAVVNIAAESISEVKVTPAAGRGKGSNLTITTASGPKFVIKGQENDTEAINAIAEALKPLVQATESGPREVVEYTL